MNSIIRSIGIVPLLRRIVPLEILKEAAYVNRYTRGKVSFRWNTRCFDQFGNLKWDELEVANLLHDEGEQAILQAVYDEQYSVPANYYIGLDNRGTIAEADTLSSLSGEPAVGGYARQAVASDNTDWTVSKPATDYQAKSKTVTFTPSGADYPAVQNMFLCDVISGAGGKIHASVALSASRTVLDGDSLNTDITILLSE